ncbi:DNA topoisomerase IB [bacterium]|nr:MAG: DNA topoisomerase IB [bacterium]
MITRKKAGKSFYYFDDGYKITDASVIERIDKLAIPPAWSKVEVAGSARSKIQAKGYDAAGRLQSIYSPSFRIKQDAQKFERILRFADALPALRRQVDKDLSRRKLSKDKVLACVVKLIDDEFFRVGNEQYARDHSSYGITTLRSKHATITNTTVTFDFIGKSGQSHIKKIKNPKIARIIKQLDEMPGYEIFRYIDESSQVHDLHSKDVNEYIKRYAGDDFTAKDFRTWGGTLLATSALLAAELEENESKTARQKRISSVVKQVAKRLGNTPAIARSSYIDPRVFTSLEDPNAIPKLQEAISEMRPKKYMTVEEQCVLKLLAVKA